MVTVTCEQILVITYYCIIFLKKILKYYINYYYDFSFNIIINLKLYLFFYKYMKKIIGIYRVFKCIKINILSIIC